MSRRRSRRLLRIAGWLLTPVVVWAAAFFGGWLAALLSNGERGGNLGWLVAGAVLGGTVGLAAWLALARWRRVTEGRKDGTTNGEAE